QMIADHQLLLAALLLGEGGTADDGEGRPAEADRLAPEFLRRSGRPVAGQADVVNLTTPPGPPELGAGVGPRGKGGPGQGRAGGRGGASGGRGAEGGGVASRRGGGKPEPSMAPSIRTVKLRTVPTAARTTRPAPRSLKRVPQRRPVKKTNQTARARRERNAVM